MKKIILTYFILFIFGTTLTAQIKYAGKIETNYLSFQHHTFKADINAEWKGFNLKNGSNGIGLNTINGVKLSDKLYTGLGIGYLNFEGIHGMAAFVDIEYLILKTRFSPFINLRYGYNHIWNQYDGGKTSALFDLGLGVTYQVSEKINIYLQSGILITQQSFLTPIRIGVQF